MLTGEWWDSLTEEEKLEVLVSYKVNRDYANKSWTQLTRVDKDFLIILCSKF